jgi:hypothetical protein
VSADNDANVTSREQGTWVELAEFRPPIHGCPLAVSIGLAVLADLESVHKGTDSRRTDLVM